MSRIHKVRQPFMARAGQFSSGSVLAIGIAVKALEKIPIYKFKIGESARIYQAVSKDVLQYARDKGSIWINRKKQAVAVVPVFLFEGRIPDDPKQPDLFKEKYRADIDG